MARLTITDSGVLYRNPLPGHQAVIAFGPFIMPLSPTELICAFKRSQAMYAADGMIHLLRSTDGGRSWAHEGPVVDRSLDPLPYQYNGGPLTRLGDGSLVMTCWRCDRSDPSRFYVNPNGGGSAPLETVYLRSTDRGRTWSRPRVAQLPPKPDRIEPAAGGPVIELADGRWMQLYETWNDYENSGPMDLVTYVLFSDDEGRTWADHTTIADGQTDDRSYSHGHLIHLPDGRFYGLYWTADAKFRRFQGLWANLCDDATGRAWGQPFCLNIAGQTSYPVALGAQRMAIIYCERNGSQVPGIKVVICEDYGRRLDPESQAVVWDAYGKQALGAPRTDRYPSSHDVIAYGAPHLVRLHEDELMACFWCTQSADTHARFCRLKID